MGGGAGRRGPREVDVALNPEELPGSPIGGELRKELMGKVPPDGEPGVARIRVDEDVLMHLANALGPRRHTHMFAAMTCISAAGLVVLIAIAIGGIIKLDELNQEIGSLQEIQVCPPCARALGIPPSPTPRKWVPPAVPPGPPPPRSLTRGAPRGCRQVSRVWRPESRRCRMRLAT